MARYIKEFPIREEPAASYAAIGQYLTAQGFKYVNYKGENVFQKGNGWLCAPTFIKISYAPDRVRFETWLKYALLPGVFVGEIGMTGFVGAAVKGTMKKCAWWIEQRLTGNPAVCGAPQPGYIPAAPQPGYIPAPSNQPVYNNRPYGTQPVQNPGYYAAPQEMDDVQAASQRNM